MEALLVVDIQPETVRPRRAERFLPRWNELIGSCDPEHVAYIANLRPFARVPGGNPFQDGLSVVSDNVFFKRAPNAFMNSELAEWMRGIGAQEVALIGIDGNWCIKATALGALRNGFRASVIADAVCSSNERAFRERTVSKLLKRGVFII